MQDQIEEGIFMVLKIFRSKKFTKRTLIVLLVLIIPAFVLWGVGNLGSGPELIGKIAGKVIYPRDLANSADGIKAQILFSHGDNFNVFRQILKNRVLINYMAWERLILLNASRGKSPKITNQDVIAFISQHPVFQRNGVFDTSVYNYVLRNALSMDPRQFEELIRENLGIHFFRQSLLSDIKVSDEEVRKEFDKTSDKVTFSYVFLDKSLFLNDVSVSEEEVKTYYDKNKAEFFEKTKAEVDYVKIDFQDAETRKSAVRILKEILPILSENSAEFKETAAEYELDYAAPKPFPVDGIPEGVPFFEDFQREAFRLEEGNLSSPIFSSQEDIGTVYILRKIKDIPPAQESFETVREEIIKLLTEKKCLVLAKKEADVLYNDMTKNDLTLKQAAKELNQEIRETKDISFSGYIENVGPAESVVLAARVAGDGNPMPPVTLKNGVLLGTVKNIIPGEESEFVAQKEAIRKQLLDAKQMAAIKAWFDDNNRNIELKKPLEKI